MAMTKVAKENIKIADEIVIEKHSENMWAIFVRKNGSISYVPGFYKTKEGARRAVLRLNPTAPIFNTESSSVGLLK